MNWILQFVSLVCCLLTLTSVLANPAKSNGSSNSLNGSIREPLEAIVANLDYLKNARSIKMDNEDSDGRRKCLKLLQFTRENYARLDNSYDNYLSNANQSPSSLSSSNLHETNSLVEDLLLMTRLSLRLIQRVDQQELENLNRKIESKSGLKGLLNFCNDTQNCNSIGSRKKDLTELDYLKDVEEFAGTCKSIWAIMLSPNTYRGGENLSDLIEKAREEGGIRAEMAGKVSELIELRKAIIELLERRIERDIAKLNDDIKLVEIEIRNSPSYQGPQRPVNQLKMKSIESKRSNIELLMNKFDKLEQEYSFSDRFGLKIMDLVLKSSQ